MSLSDAFTVNGVGRGLGRAEAPCLAADGMPMLCLGRAGAVHTARGASGDGLKNAPGSGDHRLLRSIKK